MNAIYTEADYNPMTDVYVESGFDYQTREDGTLYGNFGGIYASGEMVRRLQTWLNQVFRYGVPLKVDGLYGEKTRARVRQLQEFLNATFGEHLKVDGLYGCNTYRATLRHYRQAGWPPPPPPIWGYNRCMGTTPSPTPTPSPSPQPSPSPAPKEKQKKQTHTTKKDDKIFGLDKKIVFIGGAVLVGLLAILILNREE